MALILAINPGNSHSPTLARLARELHGHELIGADSCAVAITAIRNRIPDLVLLPDKSPRGETELLAQLRTVRGGIPTRKLPPVSSADPVALAKEIRAVLTREPKAAPVPVAPAVPSPHVTAAAKAAIAWIHARRAQWAAEAAGSVSYAEPNEPREPNEPHEPHEPYEPYEPAEPDALAEPAEPTVRWLPRVAIAAGVIGAAAAVGISFWPPSREAAPPPAATVTTPPETTAPPAEPSASVPPDQSPPNPAPAAARPVPALPDPAAATTPVPAAAVVGWVAVSAPFELVITSDNVVASVDQMGRVVLAPGIYRLRFQNRELGYDETRTVEVKLKATTAVTLLPETNIGVTANEPAEVSIDGRPAGSTPFEGRILLGSRTITVRSAGGERQFTIDATTKPVRLEVDFARPQ